MQLTNVLRDVGEDIQRNRVYLPLNELEENGITEAELNGDVVLNKAWGAIYSLIMQKRASNLP